MVKAVAGREGDVWLAGGTEGGAYGIWHSTDSGASFTRLASVQEADTIGFGRAAPGQTYPALYASAQVGGVRGLFRSVDAGASWVRINDDQHQYGSTNAAITGDPRVFGRVYVSTNGRGIIVGEAGPAGPDFALAVSPSSVSVAPGACVQVPISIVRSGGFAAAVTFSATGLPSGGTANFNPPSPTGTSTAGTFCIPANAPAGTITLTVTATGGGLTRTVAVTIAVTPVNSTFTLAASPSSLSLARGASGSSTVNISRTNFTGAVAFTISGLPAGVIATFSPSSTTGNSVGLMLAASSTAALGTSTLTVNGSSGGLTRSATVSLTVTGDTGTGGVTVTPAVTANSAWFNEEVVRISNTAPLTALSVTIVIQRTAGVGFGGQYNTVGGQIQQSNSSTPAAVTYSFNLAAGQTLGIGSNRTFAAQTSGQGAVHPTAGDTYTVTYTTGGVTYTQTGHF